MNILLVKPCSTIKNNIHFWLKNYFDSSLTISVATSYSLAMEIINRGHVDIVIAKAGRGPIATHALIDFINKIAGRSKVIVYASHDITITKENPYKQGVDGFISMWDIPKTLVLCIKRVMRGFSYQSPLFI